MKKESFGSLMALVAAAVAVALFVAGPATLTGQPPGGGGKGGAKAPAGPIPRGVDGKPDMNGWWGPVSPGGNVDIEPQAKGGGAKGGGAAKGGAPGGAAGAKGGAPGAAPGGAAPGGGRGGGNNVIVDPADGRIPYTAAARVKQEDITANKMFLEPELHCFPSGVPHNMWVQFGSQYIQNKDYLVMMWEFKHDRRIIPLDGRPLQFPEPVRQFQGESSGKWDGDTLVITTKNQTDKTWFDTHGRYAPKDIEVVERLTMTDSNTIQYEATVTSATEFTQPMKLKGTISRTAANGPDYEQMEFGCVEGNQDLSHYTQDQGGKAENVGALKQ